MWKGLGARYSRTGLDWNGVDWVEERIGLDITLDGGRDGLGLEFCLGLGWCCMGLVGVCWAEDDGGQLVGKPRGGD